MCLSFYAENLIGFLYSDKFCEVFIFLRPSILVALARSVVRQLIKWKFPVRPPAAVELIEKNSKLFRIHRELNSRSKIRMKEINLIHSRLGSKKS